MMNRILIEHVCVGELPPAWSRRFGSDRPARVTVRIEPEAETAPPVAREPLTEFTDDPMCGMWRDREDMADVDAYMDRIRGRRV